MFSLKGKSLLPAFFRSSLLLYKFMDENDADLRWRTFSRLVFFNFLLEWNIKIKSAVTTAFHFTLYAL